jgi:hypothetical protein
VLRPIPPQIGPARTRRIPSGVEVMTPERNVRIRLPRDISGYDFLKRVLANSRVDLNVRVAAAIAMLPYEKPRLIAIAPASTNPGETRLVIHGGLPRLPGTDVRMPSPQAKLIKPEDLAPPPDSE